MFTLQAPEAKKQKLFAVYKRITKLMIRSDTSVAELFSDLCQRW